MAMEDLVGCLPATPALITLDLFDYDQQAVLNVIRYLEYKLEDGVPLIPSLQSFTIQCQKPDYGHDAEFSYNALLGLLDTMSKRPTPLRRFRLAWTSELLPRRPNEWEVGGFQDLKEGGMDIYVGTRERSWI